MRTLLDKAAMFALCLILHITLTGDMRRVPVVALLAAVCCTSLCEWLPAARLRPLMPGCYAVWLACPPNSSGSCRQSPMTPCVCGPSA